MNKLASIIKRLVIIISAMTSALALTNTPAHALVVPAATYSGLADVRCQSGPCTLQGASTACASLGTGTEATCFVFFDISTLPSEGCSRRPGAGTGFFSIGGVTDSLPLTARATEAGWVLQGRDEVGRHEMTITLPSVICGRTAFHGVLTYL